MDWKGEPVSDVSEELPQHSSGMSQHVLPPCRLSGSAQLLPHTIKNLLESAGLGGAVPRQHLTLRAAVCCDPLRGRELLLCRGYSWKVTPQEAAATTELLRAGKRLRWLKPNILAQEVALSYLQ